MVARTLAERGFRVVIIEAGQDRSVSRMPAEYLRLFGTDQDWDYSTVPQAALANRRLRWPRGRGPGGSTRINATIWFPPTEHDLDQLSIAGGLPWSREALMHSLAEVTTWVAPESPRWISDTTKRFISAAHSLGLDAHAYQRMTRSGRRRTAHDLMRESDAASLITMQHGEAQSIEFASGHARAVHVRCEGETDARVIYASHGVIVCSGTIGSAELLMRSGIGPAAMLEACGIEPIVASEQVGKNLADHLIMPLIFATEPRHRFPSSVTTHDMARFAVSGTGPLASNLAEAGGLQRLASGEWFQWHVTPTHYLLHPDERAPPAMTLGVNLSDPKSRGTITLRRDSAASSPRIEIDPAYHTDVSDLENLRNAIDATRTVVECSTLSSLVREELIPGTKREGTEYLHRSIARFSQTLYHPTGTCRMGSDDQSVVDASLAVRGVDDLYVIDASVLPTIPLVNPNATVMMIARHAANQIC